MPMATEITVATALLATPTTIDTRAPKITRLNRSRPRLSVPNRNRADGGASRSSVCMSFMPYGAR